MHTSGTILVVDDNPNNLHILTTLLGQAGYQVRAALSGEIALQSVAASPPDLILLDIRMPGGMDGYATCAQLQQQPASREIPVIFISALHDTADKLTGFKSGCVDYIAKPFQAEEVLARVKTHMQLRRIQHRLEAMVMHRTRELSASESRYRVLFEHCPIAIMVFDTASARILAINEGFTRMLGYTTEQAHGQRFDFAAMAAATSTSLTSAGAAPVQAKRIGQLRWRHRDGECVDIDAVLQQIEFDGSVASMLMLLDVSETRRAEERLRQAAKEHQQRLEQTAYYDSLSGLPNRGHFTDLMHAAVERANQRGSWLAVFYFSLDNLKDIVKHHGRTLGNRVLVAAAERLRTLLGEQDLLARVGNAEFALVLEGLQSETEFLAFQQRLHTHMNAPFRDGALTLSLTVNIGTTLYPDDDVDSATLLRHADQATMLARQSGIHQCGRFDAEGAKRLRQQQQKTESMRLALERGEFTLYFQPKVCLTDGAVIGAEALLRWRHPERGLLAPGAFLPDIEDDPFMVQLGHWVIETALNEMAHWRDQHLHLPVSVNVAVIQMQQADFIDKLSAQLQAHRYQGNGTLELEVLESSSLDDIERIERIISACHALGAAVSLDDFGTGYSTLTCLRRLSADTLKIDQSFTRTMLEDAGDMAIVSGVIALAKAFQRKVIAEGVETVAHGSHLLAVGCPNVQGYGIARPMPASEIPAWIASWPDRQWHAACAAAPQRPASIDEARQPLPCRPSR